MDVQTEPPLNTPDGHAFRWHDSGENYLNAEIEAIATSRTSILFECYLFRASKVGERFRDAMTDAAGRGVQVTLLLDDVGCWGLHRNYFSELIRLGGKVVWFNPVRWRFWSFRDHRKLLVVDEAHAFVGGCNIAPEYAGDGIHEGWRDGGISITGPVVRHLAASIASQIEIAGNQIWRVRKNSRSGWVKAGGDVSLLLIRPGLNQGVFQRALHSDLQHARDIAITTAYFLPVGRVKQMLLRAARRAHSFRLLLPGKSDVPLLQVAARALYSGFLRRGAQIHEYQPQVLHAKVLILDDVVYIGSSNIDPRSLVINFEVMLRIRSAALAKEARRTFERDLDHSVRVKPLSWRKPSNWWQRLKQKLARFIFTRLDLGVAQYFAQRRETALRRTSSHGSTL